MNLIYFKSTRFNIYIYIYIYLYIYIYIEKPPQARVEVDSQIPVLENLAGEEQQNF